MNAPPRFLPWACLLAAGVMGGISHFISGPGDAIPHGLPAALPSAHGEPAPGACPLAAGADGDWWTGARDEIERAEYVVSSTEHGLEAPNRAQNLKTCFRSDGVGLAPRAPRGGDWSWCWRTEAWGRAGSMRPAAAIAPVADGARVEYRRAGMVEWYVNLREGVEQGFTLAARPSGSGPLRIEGRIAHGLRALEGPGRDAVCFLDRSGETVLRYGNLVVWDARGKKQKARLVLSGSTLAIEVEDRAATYPLTIDPLMTTAAWTKDGGQAGANFGYSVATAGDVNGDGYSDVIIGAYQYDNGEAGEGRAFVYHGSASGLSSSPAWTAEGDQEQAFFGVSVAAAGDVNGDGYGDVIVGAELYDDSEPDQGRAFVYLGSATGLSASPAWTAGSDQANAGFGNSVATAGDVNGDGYSDVIVGADQYSNGHAAEGRAFVYLGSASGLSASPAWTTESDQASASLGNSVATAGDVNGDGYADVIVGAHQYSNGHATEGRALVYHGSASGLSASPAWTAESNQAAALFGNAVATAGDVNGDGYADVIIGAHAFDNGQNGEGRAFVYLGSASGLSAGPVWTAEGNQTGASFGWAVGTAGDVSGDGYADVVVGAYSFDTALSSEGRVFVYYGTASGLGASPAWTVDGSQAGAFVGNSVGTAGDVNGDGYADVIVGAYAFDNAESDEGRACVYHGSATGSPVVATWTAESNQAHAHLGFVVATAGDVNGDGHADVIVGAPFYSNTRTREGRAFVYHGSATGLRLAAAWTAVSNQDSALFAYSVATAGDVNGDGYDDVIVGAYQYDNGETDEGRAYVYLGSATGLAPTPAWTAESDQEDARFGYSVATAGDVNGDGYDDVIIGAHRYDHGEGDEGRAFVYYGSPSGPEAVPAWTAESHQSGASFGNSVATAGDVNGDGYADVIVGARSYDAGAINEGRAFVYHGSAAGLSATPDWAAESDQAEAFFGYAVAAAGDVNGDGYGDVVVGAYLFDGGETDEGRAFAYHGSPSGLTANPAWTAESDQAGASFGASVATTGNVNGDGYGDVIVGAHAYDGGQTDEGRAYLYRGSAFGLTAGPAWTAEGDQANANYGWSVATAGDVNGDGYSDVVVGSNRFDSGQVNEGRAFAYRDLRSGSSNTAVLEPGRAGAGLRFERIYPNPSRSQSVVRYVLPQAGAMRLTIHDVRGRRVALLADRFEEAGDHSVSWEGRDPQGATVPAGVYWARLESGGGSVARKIVRR